MIRPCQLRLSGRGQDIVVFREIVMKHASQVMLGRPVVACPRQSQPQGQGPDKWHLLDQLTIVAADFDLSHRTLGVLKALMTFLPSRDVPRGTGAIVFPSNATLSRRLSGMPESTLRRHLAQLVRSGIVSRHDSPNRKRYARHIAGGVARAFGFDLTPLRQLAEELETRAIQRRGEIEALGVLREDVLILRARLIEQEGQGPLTEDCARLLRRKLDEQALRTMKDQLTKALEGTVENLASTPEVSANDSQIERHIQTSDKPDFESDPTRVDKAIPAEPTITVTDVSERCRSVQTYFPKELRSWEEITDVSARLSPMLGIEGNVMAQARRSMGKERASVAVLCILERIAHIRSPGAYLRRLCQRAEAGEFTVWPMLRALENANCQLTIQKTS